jgi:topoisomerase IV subunit B
LPCSARIGSWQVHTTPGVKQQPSAFPPRQAASKIDVGRFNGLGEMMPAQLKETTMDPARRTLLRVVLLADDREGTADSVERLMGTKAEARFAFISDKAEFASDDLLDV